MAQNEAVTSLFPNLCQFLQTDANDFAGLTVMLADPKGYLIILRRWNDKGEPEVGYQHVDSPLEFLWGIERFIESPRWKPDTRPRSK